MMPYIMQDEFSSDLNPMTTKSVKGCSNAQKRICDVSKLQQTEAVDD